MSKIPRVTGLPIGAAAATIVWAASAWAQESRPQQAPPAIRLLAESLVNNQPPFLAAVDVDHPNAVYRAGETMSVGFQAEREAHLYLLYHQSNGRTVMLYPNVARRENRIPARTPIRVPSLADRFRFRAKPPLGTDVLQVLAATRPLNELDSLLREGVSTTPVPAETLTRLAEGLAADPDVWAEHRLPVRIVEGEPTEKPPVRAGLFIGIGQYKEPRLAATHVELRHSAEVMHRLMLDRGGLDPDRTRLVTDQQATKANLKELIFQWLPSVTGPGDTVFIYFSGHAGQLDNADGTEADGKDETLAPYDISNGEEGMTLAQRLAALRQSVILDDTLARWLQQLQGRQIVLIVDTCHGGGLAEGKSLAGMFSEEAARVKDISQLNTIILTSCGADEQSLFEGTPDKTMWFTYFLAQAIQQKKPLTVSQAHQYCVTGMREVIRKLGEARVQQPTLTDNVLLPVKLVP